MLERIAAIKATLSALELVKCDEPWRAFAVGELRIECQAALDEVVAEMLDQLDDDLADGLAFIH